MPGQLRVVVVGGGVSGLATAYFLRRAAGPEVSLTLLESGPRLGGKVFTQQVAGHPVDTGPDALLVRVPAMRALLEALDLDGAVVPPGASGAYVWSRGRLRRLPPSTLFGVPQRLGPLLRSGLVSPAGLARAGLDLVLPRRPLPEDPSVGELLRPRLGPELFDRLVDPLLGGVHAGPADLLSARSAAPEVDALVRGTRSVSLAARRRAMAAPPASGPALVSLDGGLSRLVDALAGELAGSDLRLATPVQTLQAEGDRFRLGLAGGAELEADLVVLATPAHVTAGLLATVAPDAAAAAAEVPYADVASLTLAYPREALTRDLDGTGFLVPPVEGLLLVGCSWLPAKWPQLADPGTVLIRGMVGRYGDRRFTSLADDVLVTTVHAELVRIMGLAAPPTQAHVQRWPLAMPQYTVGHQARLERIDRGLADHPGLRVTGAGYRGVGIASCVSQAERLVNDLAPRLLGAASLSGGPA